MQPGSLRGFKGPQTSRHSHFHDMSRVHTYLPVLYGITWVLEKAQNIKKVVFHSFRLTL